jgi:hypothetical protein
MTRKIFGIRVSSRSFRAVFPSFPGANRLTPQWGPVGETFPAVTGESLKERTYVAVLDRDGEVRVCRVSLSDAER